MGQVMEKWRAKQRLFAKFLGSLLDDKDIIDSPLGCYIVTKEIEKAIANWKRKRMDSFDLEVGEFVRVFDSDNYYKGKVVELVKGTDCDGNSCNFPVVKLEGEDELLRINNLRWCIIPWGKQYRQETLFDTRHFINGRSIE